MGTVRAGTGATKNATSCTAAATGAEVLVAARVPRLLRSAQALTGDENEAHDLVQESCARALADLAQRRVLPSQFGAWLNAIVRNTWRNMLRARRVRSRAEAAVADPLVDCTLAETRASRAQIQRLLAGMSPEACAAIAGCVGGERRATVAVRDGTTERAIEGAMYRARRALRKAGLER
jgi:DNA-directed RNA polymerase specialized sigma24 family protein